MASGYDASVFDLCKYDRFASKSNGCCSFYAIPGLGSIQSLGCGRWFHHFRLVDSNLSIHSDNSVQHQQITVITQNEWKMIVLFV